jgi:hypothetical protein
MDHWVQERRTLELQETASHIGSSIQQIYLSLNHSTILSCILTSKLDIQPFIDGYGYRGNATMRPVLDSVFNSSNSLDITLKFRGLEISATTSVILGQNAVWVNSTLNSNLTHASLTAQKFPNQTIQLAFGT